MNPTNRTSWLSFVLLAAVFFFTQQDLYYSLKGETAFETNLDEYTTVTSQGTALRRIAYSSLGIWAVGSLIRRRQYRVKIDGSLGWLIVFLLAWILSSITWSDDIGLAVRRVVLLVMISLGAFYVSRRFSLRELVLWVFFSTAGYLLIGFAAEMLLGTFHPLTKGYRFAGTMHPNQQGLNCALLFIASLSLMQDQKRWGIVLGGTAFVSLVFLFLTKSRGSLFFAASTVLCYAFLRMRPSRKLALLLCSIAVACIVLLLADYTLPALDRAINLGRQNTDIKTFGGRIPLWDLMFEYIRARPIQGYGYESFWTPSRIVDVAASQGWTVAHAHNAYIDAVLGLGLVGGIVYLFIIIVGIGRALAADKRSSVAPYAFIGMALIFAALNGLFERSAILPTHAIFASFVNMAALAWLGFATR